VSAAGGPGEGDGTLEVRDRPERWEVVDSRREFRGHIFNVRRDRVRMPNGDRTEIAQRDVIEHPGSVGILALDDADRVLLLRQYRHPAGHLLWEAPAGLRDVPGEPLHKLAERELLEETGYRADRWDTLVDVRGLTEVPADEIDFERVHEEADMPLAWVPLEEAVRKVLGGEIHSMIGSMGILAVHAARANGYRDLRPVDAPE
jgi:ADP-ribose pyrophosphatase